MAPPTGTCIPDTLNSAQQYTAAPVSARSDTPASIAASFITSTTASYSMEHTDMPPVNGTSTGKNRALLLQTNKPRSFITDATQNTPLAPSVEKAYYRKCIELKRRLNEVEAANDELKTRRVRLDRSVMKMRLERAFLLDELRKRMEPEMVDSEGSGDEGVETPPPDRPHRDKRRRQQPLQPSVPIPPPAAPSTQAPQPLMPPTLPSQHDAVPLPGGPGGGSYMYPPQQDGTPMQPPPATYAPPMPQSSPYGAPVGVPGAAERQMNGSGPSPSINREAGAVGEPLVAGPAAVEQLNGDRRITSSSNTESANVESGQPSTATPSYSPTDP